MWLERTVMFPALHSTIRDVLGSDENTIAQFILEPLAFPQLSKCFKFYGQRFIDQLSYITRTFSFYIHREYQKVTKLVEDVSPQLVQIIEQPNDYISPTNPTSITVIPGSSPTPTQTRPAYTRQQPCQTTVHREGCQQCPTNMYFIVNVKMLVLVTWPAQYSALLKLCPADVLPLCRLVRLA